VIPRARKTGLRGVRNDAFVVRLAAPPVEGAANEALVDYFAGLLRLPRCAIRIISGERGPRKRIALAGCDGRGGAATRESVSGVRPQVTAD
jgi:uncharacterized protein YggU (UPF0235/DUF167 family)